MKIERLAIKNFRNFQDLGVRLDDHAVIVGPNAVGKSNLLHALRLVLDPSLPDSLRQLREEDFWDGVDRPLPKDSRIEIVVELSGFDENDDQLASLAEHLVQTDPMVARLTYVFSPKGSAPAQPAIEDFEFYIFGGDREDNRVAHDVRRRMPVDLFPALRDAEADLATWRRSPLRPLLDRAWAEVGKTEKEALATGVDAAAQLVTDAEPLERLATTITTALLKHAGTAQATDVQLGISPRDAQSLIRIVRLLLDDGRRGIADASLGLANLLFFTLKLLELEHLVESHDRDHTFVAIEEPEAHLHPHLQRKMFRSFLRLRPHLATASDGPLEAMPATVLVTTHSPHLASIAPIRSLVILRQKSVTVASGGAGGTRTVAATVAKSTATISLDPKDRDDLERYIEVTRAEMLFSRGVVLVEGDAEMYLVPKIAELHGVKLDELGITVSSVGGTHFRSYVLLLQVMSIPFTVVTDGDPDTDRPGLKRLYDLLEVVLGAEAFKGLGEKRSPELTAANGLFAGQLTFELDLLREGRADPILGALEALAPTDAARARASNWREDPSKIVDAALLADIGRIGKGRFAQRLGSSLPRRATGLQGPRYVVDAIDFIVGRVGA